SLADRARQMCGPTGRCGLWLEGIWRGRADGMGQFDVFKVDRAIRDEEARTALFVEVEVR
ncbi:MAG TPA: hypothetical protein VFV34_19135, partial [Blastocatellia bacterium]|nr:hypothetical protein [Blastocatellia bacterium]